MARTKRKTNPLVQEVESSAPARKVYKTAAYVRLSVEDSGKHGADTIEGQKALLTSFIENKTDMELVALFCDNGRTGTDFDRPQFEKMMEEVRKGRVNCIVVKDLSRFGRNYKETGNYLERIFPFLGVRFIAVNDNYDSLGDKKASDDLIIPFKNLINEAYCRDISVKIRSQLEIKRKNGQFLGSFAAFGYLKDEQNKNKLVVDQYAADIVRDIFKWKLEGVSPQDIADALTKMGVKVEQDKDMDKAAENTLTAIEAIINSETNTNADEAQKITLDNAVGKGGKLIAESGVITGADTGNKVQTALGIQTGGANENKLVRVALVKTENAKKDANLQAGIVVKGLVTAKVADTTKAVNPGKLGTAKTSDGKYMLVVIVNDVVKKSNT